MNTRKIRLLTLFSAGQIVVILTLFVHSVYPLWIGKEITVNLTPVDPRSIFRGQYVVLRYNFSQVNKKLFDGDSELLKEGRSVYVTINKEKERWVAKKLSSKRPKDGLFLKGKIRNPNWGSMTLVHYGIEAFFTTPKRAKKIENARRSGTTRQPLRAKLMIAPNGKVALKDVIIGEDAG